MSARQNLMSPVCAAPGVLSEREALTRIIEYARVEAARRGERICAELLSAALLSLEMPADEQPRAGFMPGLST